MIRYGSMVIELVFGFLILVLLVRFYLSPTSHPAQVPLKYAIGGITNWLVRPLGFIPRVYGWELAALLAAMVVCMLQDLIQLSIKGIQLVDQLSVAATLIVTRCLLLVAVHSCQLYLVVIVVATLCRWLRLHGPIVQVLHYHCARILSPYRRIIKPINGVDLTPFAAIVVAMVVLQASNDSLMAVSSIFS